MDLFELYKKCIKGECTPQEVNLVESWLKDHPEAFEQEMLSEMREMGDAGPMPGAVREEMLAHFRSRGFVETGAGRVVGMRPGLRRRRVIGWAAAAVLLAAALTGAWLYRGGAGNRVIQTWSVVENRGSGVKLVILPDSSRIWLNSYAQIRYVIDGNSGSMREVQLTGEAYFKVKGQGGRAFAVRAGNTRTVVLGTEFNIEAYAGEPMVRVSLQEGKVQVNCLDAKGAAQDSQLLAPGEAATYLRGEDHLSVRKGATTEPQAWIKEGVVLNDVALSDALARLARKYGKRIVFDAGKAKRFQHITAYYHKTGIEQVLTQLGFTCDFTFKKDKDSYNISF